MSSEAPDDEYWMRRALALAVKARDAGEVPVGAVIVRDGELIGEGWNQPLAHHDPSAHAEILALRAAGQHEQNYRLPGTCLYATLEPCAMCAGAMVHARIERLVFATADPRTGAAGSVLNVLQHAPLNHQVSIDSGCLGHESAELLRAFFRERREKPRCI